MEEGGAVDTHHRGPPRRHVARSHEPIGSLGMCSELGHLELVPTACSLSVDRRALRTSALHARVCFHLARAVGEALATRT